MYKCIKVVSRHLNLGEGYYVCSEGVGIPHLARKLLDFKSLQVISGTVFSASLYKNLITHLLMKKGNTISYAEGINNKFNKISQKVICARLFRSTTASRVVLDR